MYGATGYSVAWSVHTVHKVAVPKPGSEAKQLGSLSQDVGIDKRIGKRTETLSLWSNSHQVGVTERY